MLRWVKYRQQKAGVQPVSRLNELWPATKMLEFMTVCLGVSQISSSSQTEDSIAWALAQFMESERLIKTDQLARAFASCLTARPQERLGVRELDWMWKLATLGQLKPSTVMADPEDMDSVCLAVKARLAPALKHSFDPRNLVVCLRAFVGLSFS